MRKIALIALTAGAALSLAACSEKTQDAAETTATSAANDTQANMEAAGTAVGDAAHDAGTAMGDAASDAAHGAAVAADNAATAVHEEATEPN
ncbi:MAG: hypothetical protein ABGW87_08640 [Sphingomonadaceae bacterium]